MLFIISKVLVFGFALLFSLVLFPNTSCLAQLLGMFNQTDFDVKFERVELVWYNHSYARDVKLEHPWYNRSMRIANASGYLLVDQTSMDVVVEVQTYKFMSNEYRYFPISISMNVCQEVARNRCNILSLLKNISNLHPCPLKKGFYYIYGMTFHYECLPPYIPRGRYKVAGQLYYKKQYVAEAHAYGEVVDKPFKWWLY